MINLNNLKKGDKVLVECTVGAVYANGGIVFVTTQGCDEGFYAHINEIKDVVEKVGSEKV